MQARIVDQHVKDFAFGCHLVCFVCSLISFSACQAQMLDAQINSIAKMYPFLVSCRGWQKLKKFASTTANGSFIRCPGLRVVRMQMTVLRICIVAASSEFAKLHFATKVGLSVPGRRAPCATQLSRG